MSKPGHPIPGVTVAGRDGNPFCRNVPAFESGIPGLIITSIVEEPSTYTTTHRLSGLRIGASRFPSISAACAACAESFVNFSFDRSIQELMRDVRFSLCLEIFLRICHQVPRDTTKTRTIDIAAQINDGKINQVIPIFNNERNRRQ